ncbi:MAG: glycosyltransferase family 2 protein [Actinobacteria bacterium]|nr:glycosyltransferase family 2 protein [Actinomycetota bacterium]
MSLTDDLVQRVTALEATIADLRELVQRAYENPLDAAAAVLGARRDPAYREAYGEEPLVSVRIGAFRGGEALIEKAIASVRAQTYGNWEAIVVVDGPEPETVAAIEALGDSRLRCVQRPRNGPYPEERERRWQVAGCHPFNHAVALARGAWIAPLDQDDEWTSEHLAALLGRARETGAEVVFGVSRVDLGDDGETWFGGWPPRLGGFGFQAAIYHAGLAPLLYDVNSHLVGEPADWNLARRMLEAGVAFEFVDRIVTVYTASPRDEAAWGYWIRRRDEVGAYRGPR